MLCTVVLLLSCKRQSETTPAPPLTLAGGKRLLPVDEGSKDASFLKFRSDLIKAVDRRDAEYVLHTLDPAIKNSFGGNDGVAEFKEMWHPERADSELWEVLGFILRHGGAFQGESFVAPYFFSSFPEVDDEDDHFSYGAVVEEDVLLFAKPEATASAVAKLSYHIVKQLDEDGLPEGWIKVETTDHIKGYLPAALYRNIVEYRAFFMKKDGEWRMNTLLAGD
jgi:hypothetical protein